MNEDMRMNNKLIEPILPGRLCTLILLCFILLDLEAGNPPAVLPRSEPAGEALADCPAYPPEGWTDGYVIANGIRIHYWRTGGNNPPMVMCHGYSDNGLCWTNLARELEADYDIIMPDARGHGFSDPPGRTDAADAQCEDLAGLIRELGLVKPVVMGHSMGSASVAWFASRYPDIPLAVILEDPGLAPRRQTGPGRTVSGEDLEERRNQILAQNNMTEDQLVARCLEENPQWGQCECEFWAPSKRLLHPDNALRNTGSRPGMADLFADITAPTLILKADAEGELRRQNEEVAGMLTNGRIVHVEGANHNVRRDQKERLLEALRAFLDEL